MEFHSFRMKISSLSPTIGEEAGVETNEKVGGKKKKKKEKRKLFAISRIRGNFFPQCRSIDRRRV